MASQVVLFDIPSRFGTCWSPNTWKSRLLLNFKGIDYETKWLDGYMIAPTCWNLKIPPHQLGTALAPYTVPVVGIDGEYTMNSSDIARAIEARFPEPQAYVDHEIQKRVQQALTDVFKAYQPICVPRMPDMLGGKNGTWHRDIRRETYGMPLKEYGETEGPKAWPRTVPKLQALAAILHERDGPFCLEHVSYSDFLIAGFLEWFKVLGAVQDVFEVDPAFEALYRACEPWLRRNNR